MRTLFLCFECINNKKISSTEPRVVYGLTLSWKSEVASFVPRSKNQPTTSAFNEFTIMVKLCVHFKWGNGRFDRKLRGRQLPWKKFKMDKTGKTGNPSKEPMCWMNSILFLLSLFMFTKYLPACFLKAQMDNLVDTLMEDESERESLVAKPICFIIIGRPVALPAWF